MQNSKPKSKSETSEKFFLALVVVFVFFVALAIQAYDVPFLPF